MARISDLRPSPIAGLWYSSNPDELGRQVDDYVNQAQLPELDGEVIAVVAPHAGYRYSGRTAGYAFCSVYGMQFDLVTIVSPMHSMAPGPLMTSAHKAYDTPLGSVWIDREATDRLDNTLRQEYEMELVPVANDNEHSLELELPFLQRVLAEDFKLLPVMVQTRSLEITRSLGLALGKMLKEEVKERSVLLVASTDLSHFYPESVAAELDNEMLRQIAAFSPEGVMDAEFSGTGSACGFVAVASVLWAASELSANAVEIVHQSNSGEVTGDLSTVVGYGAAVVLKRP